MEAVVGRLGIWALVLLACIAAIVGAQDTGFAIQMGIVAVIAVIVILDPDGAAFRRILAHEVEARDLRVVGVLIRSSQALEQRERVGCLVGGSNIEQAREMGEVIRHGDLLNREDPAERPGVLLE
jgi:hypothetical protein